MKHFLLVWLARKGWSQAELARRLGVTRQDVNTWISGKRSPPPPDVRVTIDRLSDGEVKAAAWPPRVKRKSPAEVLEARQVARRLITASELEGCLNVVVDRDVLRTLLENNIYR